MCAVIKVFTVGGDLDVDRAFALQSTCFGDEKEWFEAFLAAANGQQYIACCIGEEYVGGLFLLDMTLGTHTGKYVYALGVHPAHRGKGIAKSLLETAKTLSEDFTLICAADEKLAATYAKYGFDRDIAGTVPRGAARGVQMDISAYTMRCTYREVCGLKLSERLFAFALEECGASLYTDGSRVIASAKSGVYAAYGCPAKVAQKAQMYVKKNIDTSSIHADLILEVE